MSNKHLHDHVSSQSLWLMLCRPIRHSPTQHQLHWRMYKIRLRLSRICHDLLLLHWLSWSLHRVQSHHWLSWSLHRFQSTLHQIQFRLLLRAPTYKQEFTNPRYSLMVQFSTNFIQLLTRLQIYFLLYLIQTRNMQWTLSTMLLCNGHWVQCSYT
jgi:hypothetical protein